MILSDNIIPLVVVGFFLLFTLVIGFYAGRGIKNIKEYALGKGQFSTMTLVLTYLATNIGGGSVIGSAGSVYKFGVICTLAALGVMIQTLLRAIFIAPKIIRFKNCFTIGDIIQNLYGEKFKILAGILTMFYSIFMVGMQLSLLGGIAERLIGIDSFYIISISGIILGFYTAFGGIKSVTYTDVLQFLVFVIIIPFIATIVLKNAGGYKEIFLKIPKDRFLILKHEKFYYYLSCFLVWSIIPLGMTSPPLMQRMLMAHSSKQLKDYFLTATVFDPIFRIIIMLIGLSTLVICSNMNSKDVFPYIINNIITNSIIKGMGIAALFAVVMSTIDSYLHSAGLLLSHDILAPIFKFKNKSFNELIFARLGTIFISTISIYAAYKAKFFLDMSMWAVKTTGPILLFPLLIGILGLKTDNKSFTIGAIFGITIFFFGNYYLPISMKMLAVPISIIINALAYMTHHIIQNKGIAWIKSEKDNEELKLWIPNLEKTFNFITKFIPTPKKIFIYSRKQVANYGSYNMLFGIYCAINFTLPYFLWDHKDVETYNLMTNLRFMGGILGGLLIVKSEWNDFLKLYYSLFWHSTLTYCLPFIATVMFLLTKGSLPWLMNIGVSIFFLILLVSVEMFLILATLGVALGVIFYKYYIGPINLAALGFDTNYYLIYQVLFSTVIGLLFAYRKKFFYMIKSNQGINLGLSMGHELKNTGLNILPYSQISKMYFKKAKPEVKDGKKGYFLDEKSYKYIKENNDHMHDLSQQMIRIVKSFEQLMLEYRNSLANPQLCSLKGLIEETINQYNFSLGQRGQVNLELSQDFRVKVPRKVFIFVIDNIIRNAFKHGGANKIDIWIENEELHIRDDGKGIQPSDVSNIFKIFYTTGDKTSNGIGLAFAKQVVDTANGEIWCDSETGPNSYTEFVIKFPAILMDVTDEEQHEALVLEAEKKRSRLIAKKMLNRGVDKEVITNVTELNKKEIDKL